MRIRFIENTFMRGEAVDIGAVRDEDASLARVLIASRRAVAVVDDAPADAPAAPEQAAITGTETATAPEAIAKPRRRG